MFEDRNRVRAGLNRVWELRGSHGVSVETLKELERLLGNGNLGSVRCEIRFTRSQKSSGQLIDDGENGLRMILFLPVTASSSEVRFCVAVGFASAILNYLSLSMEKSRIDLFSAWINLLKKMELQLAVTNGEIRHLEEAYYDFYGYDTTLANTESLNGETEAYSSEGFVNPSRLDLWAVNLIILSTALTEILGAPVYCVNTEYPFLESGGFLLVWIQQHAMNSELSEINLSGARVVTVPAVAAGLLPCIGGICLVSKSCLDLVKDSHLEQLFQQVINCFYSVSAPNSSPSNSLFECGESNRFPPYFIPTNLTQLNLQQVTSIWAVVFNRLFSDPSVSISELRKFLGVVVAISDQILAILPQHTANQHSPIPVGVYFHSLAFIDGFCDFVLAKSDCRMMFDTEPWNVRDHTFRVMKKLGVVRQILINHPESLPEELNIAKSNFYAWLKSRNQD